MEFIEPVRLAQYKECTWNSGPYNIITNPLKQYEYNSDWNVFIWYDSHDVENKERANSRKTLKPPI